MNKSNKKIELTYGSAIIIAKKNKTSPQYVRNVMYRYNSGKNIFGIKALKILKNANKFQTNMQ